MGLGFVLAATMAVATFAPAIYAVLGTTIRDDMGLARWQIGTLVAFVFGTGAIVSPWMGSLADRIAPRHAAAATIALAGTGFLAIALAPTFWVLAVAGMFGGCAQGLCNPATNRLIMTQVEVGNRGLLTGVKQAGVQAGNTVGGIVLPLGAATALGWRGTVATAVVVPVVALTTLAALVRGRPVEPGAPRRSGGSPPMTGSVFRLAAYAALMGLATGPIMTYLPSFAEEGFGWSTAAAGALVSVFGVVGFLTRLSAGSLSERFLGHHRTLTAMSVITALAAALLVMAPGGAWLWPAAVLVGLGSMAWNVVANVAVMEVAPPGGAGRGSGIMNGGFLAGMASGPPLFGLSVDLTQTYRPGWVVVGVLGAAAAVVGSRVGSRSSVSA
jgi:predicted MFS family arabinose efflux permease